MIEKAAEATGDLIGSKIAEKKIQNLLQRVLTKMKKSKKILQPTIILKRQQINDGLQVYRDNRVPEDHKFAGQH